MVVQYLAYTLLCKILLQQIFLPSCSIPLLSGKSTDLDGSQIEDEDDIVQEEIESDSEFDEASPDVPVPDAERTNPSVDMTF